ncbi:MAG: DUF4886 domain-containing protein [Planctomycetaceae bacterium]|nr:DUF4886 domain-containing protein [Planctomycetaceae bacterium]MBQ2821989.1 DUF4886 domain-containing protein [Thermoguttaceae bacterium]MDO4425096.1 DUF4886 domain-containing protein [Planctomycetia bacterium]
MKRIFVFASLALCLIFLARITFAQETAAAPTAKKTVKILTIGNSFADSLRRYFVRTVNSTSDCELVIGYLNIGGCSFERHWGNIAKEIADPSKPAHFSTTYLEKIKSENWDFITIQQVSHQSWKYESFQPYADQMIAFLKENCPNAEIVIQQTWAYHPAEKRLLGWKMSQREMYEKLTAAYDTLARKHSLRVIPTGDAVQLARETEPGGYRPDDPATILTGDGFHLNARGQYLQACVWFGMLFDEPVAKITLQPKELTEEDAAFLRETAQKAINARKK